MAEEHAIRLELQVDQVAQASDFLEAYANTALADLDNQRIVDRDLSLIRHAPTDDSWLPLAEAASALREAAQWAMIVDRDRALELLTRAGQLYMALGYPFGMYLMVVAGPWAVEPPWEIVEEVVTTLAERPPTSRASEPSSLSLALLHPQQQAYALLACAGSPAIAREYRQQLHEISSVSPHNVGVTPVGALGIAIRRFWGTSRALLQEDDAVGGLDRVMDQLAVMSAVYAETMRLAMANGHLWRHAAAAVEPGDIDIAGITALATRVFGPVAVAERLTERADALSGLSRTPIELGLELAEAPPDHLPPGKMRPTGGS